MKLLIAVAILASVLADEYFYNMNNWVQPVFKQLQKRALYGMQSSPRLWDVLDGNQIELEKLDRQIRIKVSQHLQQEYGLILGRMQQLIDILKNFALDMIQHYHAAVESEGGAASAAELYVQQLNGRAKLAISQIATDLNYEVQAETDQHSGKVFQSLAVRTAKDFLKVAEFSSMEISVLKQVEEVLDAVFNDKSDIVEKEVMSDLTKELRQLQPSVKGQEAVFSSWMMELIKDGVAGAQPQLHLLHGYAKQVISEACKLSRQVVENAHNYFALHKDNLGPAWQHLEDIIIIQDDQNI